MRTWALLYLVYMGRVCWGGESIREHFDAQDAGVLPVPLVCVRYAHVQVFSTQTKNQTRRRTSHVPAALDDTPSSKVCNALPRTHRAYRPVLSYRVAGSAPAKRGRYNCGQFNGQYRRDGASGRLARDYPAV